MEERFNDELDEFQAELDESDSGEIESEPLEVVQGSGRLVARLPEGSGFLILDGPGAGSVAVGDEGASVRDATELPGRDAALDDGRPLLLIHRPYKHAAALPRLLANLHAAVGSDIALGSVTAVSRVSDEAHRKFHNECAAAAIHLVDPEGYIAEQGDLRIASLSDLRKRRAPHLAGTTAKVPDILDLQRRRGANLLLTSGRALDTADPQGSLDAACTDGDEALASLESGERLALNLTMSAAWLMRPQLRALLLAQLLDQEQFDTWYIRVQWSGKLRTQSQPVDPQLLEGYRELAELAVDEERRLLLPNAGLTGWLMLGFGATGFGTGLGGSEQAFKEESDSGGGRPPIERYFERQLLHTIERTTRHLVTSDPNYVQCTCPYCKPLLSSAVWSHEYSGLHQLYNTGLPTAATSMTTAGRGGPHAAIRRTVRAAAKFAVNKQLLDINEPRHLRAWDQLL